MKAVLEIEMPRGCLECQMRAEKNWCMAIPTIIDPGATCRPDRCPLKIVPETGGGETV